MSKASEFNILNVECEKRNGMTMTGVANVLDELFERRTKVFEDLVDVIADVPKMKTKVLICGNGGLAAESSHFAAELMGKFAFDCFIPCVALNENSALVTAISNDMGYENVFAHQVKVLGNEGDIFIGMTTSRSQNIERALNVARTKGFYTVIICGEKSGKFYADLTIVVEGSDVAEIQESTIKYLHKLAYDVKKKIIGG